MAYIEFDHVVKEYPSGSSVIPALDESEMTDEDRALLSETKAAFDTDRKSVV